MNKIKSVILIDNNTTDNFINRKVLNYYGTENVSVFTNASEALSHLKITKSKYQLILVDIYMPLMDGYEFINEFNRLGLQDKQGEICLLSCSINPIDKYKSEQMNIKIIEKPLTIEKFKEFSKSNMSECYG